MNRPVRLLLCVLAVTLSAGCAYTLSGGSCPFSPGMANESSIFSTPSGARNEPAIQVSETLYDFGAVNENSMLSHAFRIGNNGTAPLQIKYILPG
jgi:hypothetical protein